MRANTIHRALVGPNQMMQVKGAKKKMKSGSRKIPGNVSLKSDVRQYA